MLTEDLIKKYWRKCFRVKVESVKKYPERVSIADADIVVSTGRGLNLIRMIED
jgi:electron transfer flavoprotein alpha subunit